MSERPDVYPKQAIRRFDVFAEYTRQERRAKGYPEDEAKGYGIWLAKVVAARRFGRSSEPQPAKPASSSAEELPEPKFRSVADELQTNATFDHDIIDRMGADFYERVFVPVIAAAIAEGKNYTSIRDAIRTSWKPAKA
jgi:hypothetical protein